jgi:dynein heavy chain
VSLQISNCALSNRFSFISGDANVPKFLPDDLPLFGALIQDLFPGLLIPDGDYGELDTAIRHSIDISGLQQVPGFVTKVMQLHDTFLVRFGVMIVGPTGSGKSACHDVLAKSLTALYEAGSSISPGKVQSSTLNPKSISMDELVSRQDPAALPVRACGVRVTDSLVVALFSTVRSRR